MAVAIACDLRHLFGPARDQGVRPTCLAFAASDAHAALRPDWEPLSCEYAYFHAVRRDGGHPDAGATLDAMMVTLREDGQPTEVVWPYLPALPADLADWRPPAELGALFRRDGRYAQPSVETILQSLDDGRPLIVALSISGSFYRPDSEGVVMGSEPVNPSRRHAVVALGHGTQNGETFIFVRNSWGLTWGVEGHGWVSEQYLTPRLLNVALLTEDLTDVSTD